VDLLGHQWWASRGKNLLDVIGPPATFEALIACDILLWVPEFKEVPFNPWHQQ